MDAHLPCISSLVERQATAMHLFLTLCCAHAASQHVSQPSGKPTALVSHSPAPAATPPPAATVPQLQAKTVPTPPAATNPPPLPPGFQHSVKFSTGKPDGYVQYLITYPEHGEKSVDRVPFLATYFEQHCNCRYACYPLRL